jgi:DnaJ-class molecular chaperone
MSVPATYYKSYNFDNYVYNCNLPNWNHNNMKPVYDKDRKCIVCEGIGLHPSVIVNKRSWKSVQVCELCGGTGRRPYSCLEVRG